jgi:hypothetical protein
MKIVEVLNIKLYHGSRKEFPVGFILRPQSDGYVFDDDELGLGSSAPRSRAVSMKRRDCSGSSGLVEGACVT